MSKNKAVFSFIHDATHFLMILRRGGELGFPGGKQEEDESLLETARREGFEEILLPYEMIPASGTRILCEHDTRKFTCVLLMTPESHDFFLDGVISNSSLASHNKEVDGVLKIRKKASTIQNLIDKHPLAPTVKEELEEIINYLKGE